jgi:hypothetical protein
MFCRGNISEKLRIAKARAEYSANIAATSVADPDPGSGIFLTPGSGIRNRF